MLCGWEVKTGFTASASGSNVCVADNVKRNQRARYLVHRSFSSEVTVQTQRHTHWTSCYTWTTKVVDNNWKYLYSAVKSGNTEVMVHKGLGQSEQVGLWCQVYM